MTQAAKTRGFVEVVDMLTEQRLDRLQRAMSGRSSFVSSRLGEIVSYETKSEPVAKEERQHVKTAMECLEDRQ